MESLWTLLLTALVAAAVGAILSTLAAWFRHAKLQGRCSALDVLFLLPLALPAVVAFFGPLLACSIANAPKNYTPAMALIINETIWALPVFYLCAIMGFRNVARETLDAARLQGMGLCGIFWRVYFPPAWPWLLGGFLIGLARVVLLALMITPLSQSNHKSPPPVPALSHSVSHDG